MEKEQILRYHRDEWLFVAAGVADAVVLPFYDERFHLSHAHKVMLHRVETPFGADVPNQDGKPAVPAQGHKELLDNVIQLFHKLGIAGTPGKVILMRRAPHISGVRDQIMVGRVEKNQICRIVHFVPQRIPSANTAGRGGIEVIQKRAHTKALRRRLARPRAGHRIKERKVLCLLPVVMLALKHIAENRPHDLRRAVSTPLVVPAAAAFRESHKRSEFLTHTLAKLFGPQFLDNLFPAGAELFLQYLYCAILFRKAHVSSSPVSWYICFCREEIQRGRGRSLPRVLFCRN